MPQAATSLRSVALLTMLTLGQMGLQFGFQILLAKQFGTESDMDAFVAALTLPMVISGLLAGALASAFVPVFVETKQRASESAAWSMGTQITCWLFFLTVVLWQTAKRLAEPWMQALQPGFADEQVLRTAELFRILSSLIVWNTLGGLARAWNHCLGRFAVSGLAGVVGNGVTLAVAWQRGGAGGMDAIAQAVSLGAVVAFGLQMPWIEMWSRGWRVTPESQAALRRCGVLLLPLLILLSLTQLDPLLDRYLTSALSPGSVSQLGYASRIAAAVLTLTTGGLAVVVFPALARHAAERDDDKLCAEIAAALRFLLLLLVPVISALVWFGQPLIHDLLERGRFSANDTHTVAVTLVVLCGMIVGGSLGEVSAKVFFSQQNTRMPLMVGVVGFLIGVALKFTLIRTWGIVGIAAATSVFYLINAVTMFGLTARQLGLGIFRGVPGTLLRAAIGTAVAVGLGRLIVRMPVPYPSLCGAVLGGFVLLVVLLLLRDEVAWRALRVVFPARTQEPPS